MAQPENHMSKHNVGTPFTYVVGQGFWIFGLILAFESTIKNSGIVFSNDP